MKQCSTCKQLKPLADFYSDYRRKDGLYRNCKECHLEATEKWRKKNLIKKSQATKRFYHFNLERMRKWHREYQRERKQKDVRFHLDSIMKTAICNALKNKTDRWFNLVGYSVDKLMKHLEKKFTSQMNWDNYGNYWVIDHIKPRSLFHYQSANDPEFKECWALRNLQPLEKIANLKKFNFY